MGNLLQYQDLIGNGNLGGTPGDCPKGFVCLKNGNCGGRGILQPLQYTENILIIIMSKIYVTGNPTIKNTI